MPRKSVILLSMTAKWFVIISGVVFWSFGLLTVVSYHSKQDHKKIDVEYSYLKPIDTTACKYCFVELE